MCGLQPKLAVPRRVALKQSCINLPYQCSKTHKTRIKKAANENIKYKGNTSTANKVF